MLNWTTFDIDPRIIIEGAVVGFAAANCYLVACADTREAVVIDPGTMGADDTGELVSEARRLDLSVRWILNTHGHPDHVSGNDFLKDAVGGKVLIHEFDAAKLTDPVLNASRLFGMDITVRPPDGVLRDGDVVRFGNQSLTTAHTPGHSSGGVVFIGERVVFTGDTLFAGSIGRSDLPDSSAEGTAPYDVLLSSIRERLLTLADDTVVLSGHGPPTTIGRERAENPFLRGGALDEAEL